MFTEISCQVSTLSSVLTRNKRLSCQLEFTIASKRGFTKFFTDCRNDRKFDDPAFIREAFALRSKFGCRSTGGVGATFTVTGACAVSVTASAGSACSFTGAGSAKKAAAGGTNSITKTGSSCVTASVGATYSITGAGAAYVTADAGATGSTIGAGAV